MLNRLIYTVVSMLQPRKWLAVLLLIAGFAGIAGTAHAQAACGNQTWGNGIPFAFHNSEEAAGVCGAGPSPVNGIRIFLDPGNCTNNPSTNGALLITGQDSTTGEVATSMTCTGAGCAGINSNHFYFSSAGPAQVEAIFNVNGDTTPIKFSATLNRSATAPYHCSWSGAQIEGGFFGGTSPTAVTTLIDHLGNGNSIPSFPAAPTTANHTDFGNQDISAGAITRTYTLKNDGTSTLQVHSIGFSGASGPFSIVGSPTPANVAPGGSTTFDVSFDPTVIGVANAVVRVASNARNHTTFDWRITGNGIGNPEIAVSGNGANIPDGTNTPAISNHTEFGAVPVASGTVVRTFTIENTGSANLTIAVPTMSGPDAADFSVTSNPTSPVTPGNTTTFAVAFDPSAAGVRNAVIDFGNNDADENPYNFAIRGTGQAPDIAIHSNSTNITDGQTATSTGDNTDFGSIVVGVPNGSSTFVVTNPGTATLNVGSVTVSGANASEFTVATNTASGTGLAAGFAGGTANFAITFSPAAAGLRTATVTIISDDPDENPFTFNIQGTGFLGPEVEVSGNGAVITDGDTTPAAADDTDFGSVNVASGSVANTFTIKNTGDAPLTLGTFSSTDAAFTVAGASGPIAPNASATFTVTFDPSVGGATNAVISFVNNDADEDPYDFAVTGDGTVTSAPTLAITGLPGSFTTLNPIPVTFTFDQAVTGFTLADVAISGGTLSGFTGGPTVWTATVTPTGTGDITISVAAGVATNTSAQPNTAASVTSIFDTTVQTSQTIGAFMTQRNAALLAHQPDITLLGRPGGRRFSGKVDQNGLSFAASSFSNPDLWFEINGSKSFLGTGQQEYLFGVIGTQKAYDNGWIVGAMLQFDHAVHTDGIAEISGQGVLIGPYFVKTLETHPYTIDGRLLIGRTWNEVSPFGTYTDKFETQRILATLEATGQLEYEKFMLMPKVSFAYVSDKQEAYTDSTSTLIPGQTVNTGTLSLGTDWSMPIPTPNGALLFTGGIAGIWGAGNGPNSNLLEGVRGRIDVGLEYFANKASHLEVDIFYDGLGKSNYESFGVSLSWEYKF